MNPFALTRNLPDGRKAAGPLVYILLSLGILGLFIYYNFRASEKPRAKVTVVQTTSGDVAKIRQAATATGGAAAEATPTPFSLPVGSTKSSSPFDQVAQAVEYDQVVQEEKEPTNEKDTLDLATPTPMPIVAPQQPAQEAPIDVAKLYRQGVTPTPTPTPTTNPVPVQTPVAQTGFQTKNFLPRGAVIPVYVLSTIKTGALEDIVELGVAKNVIFNGKVQIPFGTRILGQAASDGDGDRMAVNVDTILYPNGNELPINAIVKGIDKAPGIKAYYIPQPLWMQLLPYVNNFIAAYLMSLQNTTTQTWNATDANGNPTSSTTQEVADVFDTQTQLVTSASQALQQATMETMKSLNNLYKPYLLIPPGTPAYVVLRQATDLTLGRPNGAQLSTMPQLPGFTNNPIPTSGLDFSNLLQSGIPSSPTKPTTLPTGGSSLSGNQVQQGYQPPNLSPTRVVPGIPIPDLQNPRDRQDIMPAIPTIQLPTQGGTSN